MAIVQNQVAKRATDLKLFFFVSAMCLWCSIILTQASHNGKSLVLQGAVNMNQQGKTGSTMATALEESTFISQMMNLQGFGKWLACR